MVTAINSGTEDPTGVTNSNGTSNSQTENTLGQTTTQSGAGLIASKYGYNADGQLTSLTTYPGGDPTNSGDAKAATTGWQYDQASGLMTSKHYADGTQNTYKYNAAGQLKTVIEPGMSASFGYNAAGIQTSSTAIDSQTGLVSSQVQALDDQGRPMVTTSIDNGQISTETETYTALGQPQNETFGSAGNVTVAHGYYPTTPGRNDPSPTTESPNALASMTIQNLPNGQANAQTSYAYDPTSKRLQTITVNGVTFTIAYWDGSASQIASITTSLAGVAGTALTTDISLDPNDPALLGGIGVTTGAGGLIYSSDLSYNQNDQIATDGTNTVDDSGNLQANNYVYTYGSGPNDNTSDANSLTKVTDNGIVKETYAYDGVGNFVDPALGDVNTLNQYAALSYNLRGDVTNDSIYAYTYDANDRMISVTPDNPVSGSDKLTYGYDSQGRRTWKDVYVWDPESDGWEYSYARHYVYDGVDLVGELDAGNVLLTGYTWGPNGQLLAVTDYTQATPKTYEAVIDASGDTAMLVDPTTETVGAVYTYDSYGNLLTATGPAQAVCSILGKGLYYDIEARSIGHALNRDVRNNIWYEHDPAGEIIGGANLYQYLGGDPIDLSDTSGTAPDEAQEILTPYLYNAMQTISNDPSALYNSRYNALSLVVRTAFYDGWASAGNGVSMTYGRLRSEISQSLGRTQNPGERAALRTIQAASYPMEATSDAALTYSAFEGTGLGSAGRSLYTAPKLGLVFRPAIKGVTYGLTANQALGMGSQIANGNASSLTVNDFVDLGFGLYGSYHLAGGRNGYLDPRNYNWASPNGVSVDGQVAFGANRWLPVSYNGPSATYTHNQYVIDVLGRGTAQTRRIPTYWSQGNAGMRIYDGFSTINGTAFEGNTTPWNEMTWGKFNQKMTQIAADKAILNTPDSPVKRVIWFGTQPLPSTGYGGVIGAELRAAGIPYYVVNTK